MKLLKRQTRSSAEECKPHKSSTFRQTLKRVFFRAKNQSNTAPVPSNNANESVPPTVARLSGSCHHEMTEPFPDFEPIDLNTHEVNQLLGLPSSDDHTSFQLPPLPTDDSTPETQRSYAPFASTPKDRVSSPASEVESVDIVQQRLHRVENELGEALADLRAFRYTIHQKDQQIFQLVKDQDVKDQTITNLTNQQTKLEDERHALVQSLVKYRADFDQAWKINDEYAQAIPDPDHPPMNINTQNYIDNLHENVRDLEENLVMRDAKIEELQKTNRDQSKKDKKIININTIEIKSLQSLADALKESSDLVREHNSMLISRNIEVHSPAEHQEFIVADFDKCEYAYKLLRERLLESRTSITTTIQPYEEKAEKAEAALKGCEAQLEDTQNKLKELDSKILDQELEIEMLKRDNEEAYQAHLAAEDELSADINDIAERYSRVAESLPEQRYQLMLDYLGEQNMTLSGENRKLQDDLNRNRTTERALKRQIDSDMHYSIMYERNHDQMVERLTRAEQLLKQHNIPFPFFPSPPTPWTASEHSVFTSALTDADPAAPKPDYDRRARLSTAVNTLIDAAKAPAPAPAYTPDGLGIIVTEPTSHATFHTAPTGPEGLQHTSTHDFAAPKPPPGLLHSPSNLPKLLDIIGASPNSLEPGSSPPVPGSAVANGGARPDAWVEDALGGSPALYKGGKGKAAGQSEEGKAAGPAGVLRRKSRIPVRMAASDFF